MGNSFELFRAERRKIFAKIFSHSYLSCAGYFMNEEALILIVEEDDNEAVSLQEGFRKAGIFNPIKILVNTLEAIDYLTGAGQFENRNDYPLPSLLFVDLHLTVADGLELVRWLKGQPGLAEIPVIVITDSSDLETLKESYDAGANLPFCKPADQDKFVDALRLCCEHLLVS